ncbi:MAG: hypothetical protein JF628_11865 [Sphingomonas sp.]|nr:hypothetical protein [Sphingomonas sp.]
MRPGTHDTALGIVTLDRLRAGEPTRLPRFDKARDDRAPPDAWPEACAPCDLVIFEGWCVGAVPQAEGALAEPVNDLERIEDPDARWRRAVRNRSPICGGPQGKGSASWTKPPSRASSSITSG